MSSTASGKMAKAVPSELRESASGLGIDISVIDRMFSGRVDSYIRIAGIFIRKAEENIAEIRDLLESGRLNHFVIASHGAKGAASNLGILRLSETARELELLGKAGDAKAAGERLPAFAETYRRAAAALSEIVRELESL